MIKTLGFFSLLLTSFAHALVPLEGLLYGDVSDIPQVDPLEGIYSTRKKVDTKLLNSKELKEFKEYVGFYRQGANLVNSCSFNSSYRYASSWQEKQARRSIVSTLQYIGLDVSIKAIIKYMKILEYEKSEFSKLADNLISNSCSQNITVYSLKLIRKNFDYLYDNDSSFELPSLVGSPFFSEEIQDITNSRETKKAELDLSIRNFRSFCSWGGDVDNYRMLPPLLSNPYVMSYLYNQLLERKVHYDKNERTIVFKKNDGSVQVRCDDLICRKAETEKFMETFPRIIGATSLEIDLQSLYCGHFRYAKYEEKKQSKQIASWIKESTIDSPHLEAMNFVALITKKSDLLIASRNFSDLKFIMKSNIKKKWDKWARNKSDQLVTDLLYEESLNVELVSKVSSVESLKGNFSFEFNFTMGEMDRVLLDVDKIDSLFYVDMPISYLRWVRKEFIAKSNLSDYKGLEELNRKVTFYLAEKMKEKETYFVIPLWSEKIAKMMAKELQSQLVEYKGSKFSKYDNKAYSIPVKFKFGVFALKYLNNKFKSKYRSISSL